MRKGCARDVGGSNAGPLKGHRSCFWSHGTVKWVYFVSHSMPQHLDICKLPQAAHGILDRSAPIDLAASQANIKPPHKSLPSPSFTVTWHAMAYLDVSTHTRVDHNEI